MTPTIKTPDAHPTHTMSPRERKNGDDDRIDHNASPEEAEAALQDEAILATIEVTDKDKYEADRVALENVEVLAGDLDTPTTPKIEDENDGEEPQFEDRRAAVLRCRPTPPPKTRPLPHNVLDYDGQVKRRPPTLDEQGAYAVAYADQPQDAMVDMIDAKRARRSEMASEQRIDDEQGTEHLQANLLADLRTAIPHVLRHPASEKERRWALAWQIEVEKRLGRRDPVKQRATANHCSQRTVQRDLREGRELWADLIRVALDASVPPEAALEYLSSLPREQQLRVAHEARRQCEFWRLEEALKAEHSARLPKPSNTLLNELNDLGATDRTTRERLLRMSEQEQLRELADMWVRLWEDERKFSRGVQRRAEYIAEQVKAKHPSFALVAGLRCRSVQGAAR